MSPGTTAERPRDASSELIAPICTDGLMSLRGARRSGWSSGQEHRRPLNDRGCQFYAESLEENVLQSGANLRVDQTSFQYFRYERSGECHIASGRSAGQDVVLSIPLAGCFTEQQKSHNVEVKTGEMLLIGAAGEIRRNWRGPLELVNVTLPLDPLNRMLVVEYGVGSDQRIHFNPLTLINTSRAPTLIKFVEMVLGDAGAAMPIFGDPIAAKRAQMALLNVILRSLPHSHSDQVNGERSSIAPYYVRRAESHMIRHVSADITVEDLAHVAGVSPRTIYYGFRQYRLMTPMKYLKRVRLTKARGDLLDPAGRPRTVSEVASRYGYVNASQFSRDYKSLFGESPLITLRRSGDCPASALMGPNWLN